MSFEDLVKTTYDKALASGELNYTPSTVETVEHGGIPFEVRFVPVLAKKPTGVLTSGSNFNPFLPCNPVLVVTEFENHIVVLNKFCVVPCHLLIVTKEFRKQTSPLLPDDCAALWRVFTELKSQSLLAFYNCGEYSGASQPHKHIQVLPLPNGMTKPPISKIVESVSEKIPGQILSHSSLPYIHVFTFFDTARLHGHDVGDYLGNIFFSLYDAMVDQLRTTQNSALSSYNFLMTRDWMMLVPRGQAVWVGRPPVQDDDDDGGASAAGRGDVVLSVNSLGMAGMVLVKSKEEFETIKRAGVLNVLAEVALTRNDNEQTISAL